MVPHLPKEGRMRRGAAALRMAVLVLVVGAMVGFGEEFRAISFQSNGDLIQGWYWLRDPGLLHKAWWTFEGLPKDTDLVLEITCLATSRVNGPRGVSAQFLVVYGFGDAYVPKEVTLPNVSPPEDPVGYTCRGTVVIPANTPGLAVGKLTIFVQRISAEGPHVAFNKDSMVLRVSQLAIFRGYLFSVRQAWGTRSEGPLYLLQTQEFNVGLEGFYVVERGQRFPWQADPVLEALVGKYVEVRGTVVPVGKEVFGRTYPLPALIVEEIGEIVY
jgi:hypothetical protein